VSALLHAFTSSHPAPLPSCGDGVARKNLNKLQPLREALQQLRQEGLTKVHLLQTFFSRQIEPLLRRRTKMGMYLGPCCPDCASSEELSTMEVDARIHKVLDLGVSPDLRVRPVPLQRGIASARVSTLGPVSAAFVILSFTVLMILHRVLGVTAVSCGMPTHSRMPQSGRQNMPLVSKRSRREREKGRSVCRWTGSKKAGGGDPPSGSFDEGGVERGWHCLPSPLRATPSPHQDAVPLHMGATAGEHQLKHPRAEAGPPIGLPSQLLPM
jgi:hypothetical protein